MPTPRFRLSPDMLAVLGGELEPLFVGTKHVDFRVDGRIITFSLTALESVEPDEPGPGAYMIGSQLVARPAQDEDFDHWCIFSYASTKSPGQSWGTWEWVWQEIGGADVDVVPLVPAKPTKSEVAILPVEVFDTEHPNRKLRIERSMDQGVVASALFSDNNRMECKRRLTRNDALKVARALLLAAE